MKIRQVVAELFHADRRTDVTKLSRFFTQFGESVEKKEEY